SILKPIKNMVYQLESQYATIADCYVALIKIAAAINRLPNINLFKSIELKKELLECDLRDSVNGSTVSASQMEFVEQSEKSSDSFEPISSYCNIQLDEVNDTNLLIDEVIDLSNPAFVGNNNSFIKSQSMVSNNNT
ncbi:11754_t:CDS:2, partial [Racocetra fulgida]